MAGSLACGRQLDASIASAAPDYNDGMEKVVVRHPVHQQMAESRNRDS
jgi:hypothetical protein